MRDEQSEESVARNLRARVLEFLELASSKEAQLEYQQAAPGIQVSHEIFNQWEDCYRLDLAAFRAGFSSTELEALAQFNGIFVRVCEETPQLMPPIADFVNTSAWKEYSEAARAALDAIGPSIGQASVGDYRQ